MEFNWADPRKNKRVDSVMMAKAEASRVKRLTSVKSTVSNQLNPAVEHKLKTLKKKKTPDAPDERPSSRLHQRDFELGHSSNNQLPHAAKSHRTNPSASQTHSFYNEFLPRAKSVFDSIDVHAAADGLFHPASNVQAFAEHDARYAPSHEKRLPPLSSERLASRSESRLPTASSSSSSLTSYRSLGGKSGTGHRSDGDLHAPRRSGIVPSSADRNAMGLVEDELEDVDEPQASPPPRTKRNCVKPKRRTQDKSNNNNHSDETPPLEGDLTQKFEQLKRMIQKNRHVVSEKQGPEIEEDDDGATAATPSKHDTATKNTKARGGDTKHHRPVVASATSGSGQSATHVRKPKNELLARHGVSLSELKHEHRAALAMLQELGGPLSEPEDKKKARCHVPRGGNETVPSQARPSGSADRASRLVEKLRAQIPSGRDKASPRRDEDVAVGGTATDHASAALDAARVVLESDTALKEEEEEEDEDERLWRRYGGDEASQAQDDNDDDDPSEELYDDEYFEG